MKKTQRRTAIALGLGLGFFLTFVRAEVDPGDGPFPLIVTYDKETVIDPNDQQIYQDIADTLHGFANVPARLNHYSAVNNANDCVIEGWSGLIRNVQPNANDYLVKLDVCPTLTSGTYGPTPVILNGDYSEEYQVNNDGTFQYLGSLDPQGLAGTLPAIAGL